LVFGFLIGRFVFPDVVKSDAGGGGGSKIAFNNPPFTPDAASPRHLQPAHPISGTNAQLSKEPEFRLPKSLALTVIPSLLASSDKQLDSLSLAAYGLDPKVSEILLNQINEYAKRYQDFELRNASLVTESNGDQFIQINPFTSDGEAIKHQIEASINDAFAGFDDSRSELFKSQLFKSRLFSDFGESTMQISIDEETTPNGLKGYVFTTTKIADGRVVDKFSNPFELSLMESRYSHLIQKLIPSGIK